mgnify:CR=1 FL=1|tara:strand:- start:235 stop:468 length:234 start_codon:yes stop_codon:yes gene_type:complete
MVKASEVSPLFISKNKLSKEGHELYKEFISSATYIKERHIVQVLSPYIMKVKRKELKYYSCIGLSSIDRIIRIYKSR